MTQQEINARRPADKLAHPARYCHHHGCLLLAISQEGTCARHEAADYTLRGLRERMDYQCPPRE